MQAERFSVRPGLLALVAALAGAPAAAAQDGAAAPIRNGIPAGVDTTTAVALSRTFRAAANAALPAVVFIQTEQARRQLSQGEIPDEFRRFFNLPTPDPEDLPPATGAGSGFILDASGTIVTNNHVVAGAERVTVRMLDGREFSAQVVGTDSTTDVAVIRITPPAGDELPVATIGDSEDVLVGDWVLALGNPLGLDFTVTAGIVSAKGRAPLITEVESYIQTDAPINPGNSGGPLVDLYGRVVGINTAISTGGMSNRFVGYGFAVPINLALPIIDDIVEYGFARRPLLGVFPDDVSPADVEVYGLDRPAGAEVRSLTDDGPAAQAGVQVGDVIVSLEGQPIANAGALRAELAKRDPGDRVTLGLVRFGQRLERTVTLGEFERPRVAATEPGPPPEQRSEQTLGLRVAELTPQVARELELEGVDGVVVTNVSRFGPAAAVGVRRGQVITAINGTPVRSPNDLQRVIRDLEPGDVVSLRVVDPELGPSIMNYRIR